MGIRIFNSWVDAYHYAPGKVADGAMEMQAPTMTGVPFNDAYRYMDWLLTVPLLLIEILLVMKLPEDVYSSKAQTLGVGSALMIVSGYYGELTVTGDLTHVGFAGAFPCRSSCTSCMSSLWVFQLPPTTKQTLLSKARSSQHSL